MRPGPGADSDSALPAAALAELGSVYADVAREIESRGPACWASGRCCNFTAAGHRLYVTGLEVRYTLSRLDPAALPTPADIAAARARGGCPFQAGNLCGVHEIKPLGCRVYFCDRSAQAWQQDLTERMLARIRDIHDRHAIDYRYGEWISWLEEAVGSAGPGQALGGGDSISRSSSAQSRPVDLTVGGKGGGLDHSPDSAPSSTDH